MTFKTAALKSWEPNGLALKAYMAGEKEVAISIHHQDGSTTEMPIDVFFRNEDELPDIEVYALQLCQGNILDVGAGAACHSLILQKNGLDVTALEIDKISVEIIKKRGVEKVYCSSFLNFYSEEKYDTILFLMNGIGIAEKLDNLNQYFEHCKRLLSPNGQIIIDSSDIRVAHPVDFQSNYFGEVDYQLSYQSQYGATYSWLYVDPETLKRYASKSNLICQIVYEEEDGSYLARLFMEAI